MKLKSLLLFSIFSLSLAILFPSNSQAQRNIRDSAVFTPVVAVTYAALFPGGDLADRFGFTNAIGLTVNFKGKKNWIYGGEAYFLFGNEIKEQSIFEGLATDQGYIRNTSGRYAEVLLRERGWHANFSIGKVFPWFGPNPNSGVMFKIGFGGILHKIYIESRNDFVPQLEDDYIKGYDRLTVGVTSTQFIGYLYQANQRYLNFYAGFEITEGFTQGLRDYNFDTRQSDKTNRFDMLWGFKVGWLVPIYRKTKNDFHIK